MISFLLNGTSVCSASFMSLFNLVKSRFRTVYRWKLHLCPSSLLSPEVKAAIPPLPPNKDALSIFADFLQYIFTCTRQYIIDTFPEGLALWNSVAGHIEFIFSHPNGWEGRQQEMMRSAAIRAGLVANTEEERIKIQFVTEGEASLHFCIQSGLSTEALTVGCDFEINESLVD